MKLSPSAFALCGLLIINQSCATSGKPPKNAAKTEVPAPPVGVQSSTAASPSPTPGQFRSVQDTPEAGRYYQSARRLYDSGKRKEGLALIQRYVNANPQGQFADEAAFLLAKQAADSGSPESAIKQYEKVIAFNPPSRLRGDAIYAEALVQANLGRKKDTLATLARIEIREVSTPIRPRVFPFWARIAGEEGRWLESSLALIKAHHEAPQASARAELETLIEENVETRLSESELNFLLQEYPNDYPAPVVYMRLVNLRLADGKRNEAQAYLKTIVEMTPPSSKLHARAQDMLSRLGSLGQAAPAKVGVLLPLSGHLEAAGRTVLDGLELALSQPGIELVTADSGPTDQSASAAFEKLVFEDKVMAVVGPIAGSQAEIVATKAAELGVTNITLAPRQSLLEKGPYIFRTALTAERQVRALVGFSRDRLNAHRFAILFPEDNFGREYALEYFQAVKEMGGEVTAAESYNPDQRDFQVPVENLVGTGFPGFRHKESEENGQKLEEKLGRKPTKKELEQVLMPPIVDFDVLFIPDRAKPVGLIVDALLYADIQKVQLIGPATWNNRTELLSRAGEKLDKALFVDAYANERASKVTKDFTEKFQAKKGAHPGLLAGQGFDVGLALRQVYANGSPSSRDEFRARLENLGSYDGALGVETWDARRDSLSELQLYQVNKGQFEYQGGIAIRAKK